MFSKLHSIDTVSIDNRSMIRECNLKIICAGEFFNDAKIAQVRRAIATWRL